MRNAGRFPLSFASTWLSSLSSGSLASFCLKSGVGTLTPGHTLIPPRSENCPGPGATAFSKRVSHPQDPSQGCFTFCLQSYFLSLHRGSEETRTWETLTLSNFHFSHWTRTRDQEEPRGTPPCRAQGALELVLARRPGSCLPGTYPHWTGRSRCRPTPDWWR